jgi:hypothetical protein
MSTPRITLHGRPLELRPRTDADRIRITGPLHRPLLARLWRRIFGR